MGFLAAEDEAPGQVHVAPDDRRLHGLLVGDEARQVDAPVVDGDAHLEVGPALLAQPVQRLLAEHRGAHRVQGVEGIGVLGAVGDHDPVAQELVDRAAEAPHVGHERVEHGVQLPGQVALGDLALRRSG